jgi:hypothetical protein
VTGYQIARLAAATAGTALMLGIVARAQQQPAVQPANPAATQQTAAEKFKNIQVLKSMPADQLPNAMQYVAASLGVQCGFCHVQGPDGWHFDKDDRPTKNTARKMMRMVEAFNSGDNDITISCATCHNGHQEPDRTPPLATEMTPDEAARAAHAREARRGPGTAAGRGGSPEAGGGRQKPTESADDVLGKYLQAAGGASAWSQAKTIVMQGTMMARNLETLPVKVEQTITGAYRADVQGDQPMTRVFTGASAWMMRGSNARDLEGLQAAQAGRLADFGLPVKAKDRFTGLTAQRYMNLDDTSVIVLVSRTPETFEQLYFARDTGLLVRRSVGTRPPLGTLPEQIDYSDYRDVGGVKVPFQVRYTTWNQVDTFKFTDAKLNAPIADADFTRQ